MKKLLAILAGMLMGIAAFAQGPGADLTSDPPGMYSLCGETLRLIVTGSPTGKTWRATLKLQR